MVKQRILGFLTAAMMTVTAICSAGVSAASEGTMRDMTTMEIVHDMGIGINLGNTLESAGDWIAEVDQKWGDGILEVKEYETAWGSPVITQPMIQGMADEGFGVVRVPVAWSNMMSDDGTYTISDAYTKRVQEIADWVIDADMYCIINIHWDNGWVNKFPEDVDGCMRRYEIMWTQIADAFKDYDDHLIFESQNEELGWDSIWNQWGGTQAQKEESYALVNRVNQKFVDVVRASGGNNPKRHLLISGYNTSIDLTCDPLFHMPDDPANRMAVSVHYYTPVGFAILEEDASWAKARSTWGTDADFQELNQQMDLVKSTFVDKGIPVIIGEYGCPTVGKDPASVRTFLSSVCKAAYERNMCPVLWATPQSGDHPDDPINGHYNRTTCQLSDPELKKAFNEITGFAPSAPTETPTEVPTEEPTDAPTETPADQTGDVNRDGAVDIIDILTLQKWLHGLETPVTMDNASDLDMNGEIDIFDLSLLKRLLLSRS